MSTMSSWTRFQEYFLRYEDSGFSLDISRMGFSEDFLPSMQGRATRALLSMAELEKGNIANQDENRMVGHYWLRDPSLAPTTELRMGITDALEAVLKFSADVHLGAIRGVTGKRFTDVLSIGIGGSALGPQLVSDALGNAQDPLSIHFLDSGDYLQGFFRGTRTALCEKGRDSLTISVNQLNASSLGALIALYERAVGFYGFLTNINAYHQPGVEAGKQVASHILELQKKVLKFLQTNSGPPINAEEIAQHIGGDAEETFHILQHLAANQSANISHFLGQRPSDDRFSWRGLST
ncbi:MAG: hypothetical protein JMM75_02000 [Candidatus Xiphinematobacter sp.]|nr:MAG: hypothetical protein JMM75_02000 [Candidatus Xiphinematobacter sp.]